MNPASQEYFDAANGLIGRGQMGQMNFFLFTIFYADKYGDKCYNQIVTTKPLQMGIIEKFKGDSDNIIGWITDFIFSHPDAENQLAFN